LATRVLIHGMNYAPELAGVGRYTGEIAEYFASDGASVVVVTTPAHYPGWRVQKPFSNQRFDSEIRNNVRVIRCPLFLRSNMGGVWRLLAPLTFALTSGPIVVWQIIRRRPDVALSIVPTLLGAPFLLLGAFCTGARTVLHIQDLEVDAAFAVGHLGDRAWLRYLGSCFERWVIRHFDQLITVSDRMAEKIAEKGVDRDKIAVVRNWVDIDFIRPLETESPYRAELKCQTNDFMVLYSGNIGRKQGLGVLLQAAERLTDNRHIRFIIAGEGPAKNQLITRYAKLPNVQFLPFQPYERLSDFLGMADLHVLPQESNVADLVLPSKLGGMLASGKPMIVMADPGTEILQFLRDSVIAVPPGNSASLANAIISASLEPKLDPEKALFRKLLAKSLSKQEGLPKFAEIVAA
jgi:colanic acid biosynthesis glycosyl transferase WcaI